MQIKPKILTRFLMRRYLMSLLLILLIVAGIIFAVTFVEKLPDAESATAAISISGYLVLQYMPLLLPLVAFMATLLSMYNMTRSSEAIILSSAGMSPFRVMRPMIWVALIVAIIATCVINPVSLYYHNDKITDESITMTDNAIWLRDTNIAGGGALTMRAEHVESVRGGGMTFGNVVAFIIDDNAHMNQRIEVPTVHLSAVGKLSAVGAKIFDSAAGITTGDIDLQSSITPSNVLSRGLKPEQVSFWNLPAFSQTLTKMGMNPRGHLVQFWKLLFLPISLAAMVVLGFAFSETHERRNYNFGTKFSIGILVCFALYFTINVFAALGVSGSLPTILSVLVPPLLIASGAAIFIVTFDTI